MGLEMWSAMAWEVALNGINIDWTHHGTSRKNWPVFLWRCSKITQKVPKQSSSRKNRFIFLWHHPANSFSSSPSQSHCLSQSKISIVYNFLLHTGTKHPVIFNSILQNRQFHGKRSILILAVHGKPCFHGQEAVFEYSIHEKLRFHGREWHKADRATLEMSCAACFEMLACVFASAEDLLWIAFKNCIFDTLITTFEHEEGNLCVLWIAFKNCIFDTLITTDRIYVLIQFCCELLSRIVSLTHW